MKTETKRWIFDITVWTTSIIVTFGVLAYDALAQSQSFPAAHETSRIAWGNYQAASATLLRPAPSAQARHA